MSSHEGQPDFRSPPGGCDAHFHVFGPAARYPYGTDLRYAPPLAPLPEFLALAGKLGLERYVFVQPSAYGRDNRCMLDAMRELGPEKCRGIVDIDENAPEPELARLDALGVRGVRINLSPVKPFESGFAARLMPRIARLAARCAEIGWQLDFLTPGWLTAELMPTLRKLRLDFTLAHFGMFQAKEGPEQPGFRELLELLRHGERRCWVKLTGVYRMSASPDFADVAPMARALIETASDRLIWGSDYPHLSFADKVGSVQLWNLLGRWAPDEATRRRILVDNPANLFGFS
ncbi:MAG TPA: amidohydrolase family protein [Burkholderiales bacterium]|nr:amidohydrolase family protein [Burkholderiales bacterium]